MNPGPMHRYPSGNTDWRAHGLAGTGSGHRTRWLRIVLVVLFALLAGLVAVIVLLSARMIPLTTVTPSIEARISRALGAGYQVSLGATAIGLSRGDLIVDLQEITVRGKHVGMVKIPLASVFLDAGALLRGEVSIDAIVFDRPEFQPAAAGFPGAGRTLPDDMAPDRWLERVVAEGDRSLRRAIGRITGHGVRRLAIADGSLRLARPAGGFREFTGIDADLRLEKGGDLARLAISLFGQAGRGRIDFNRRQSQGGRVDSEVRFSDLTPADLLGLFGLDTGPVQADTPLYGSLTLGIDGSGAVDVAELLVDVGAGALRGRNGGEMLLDEAYLGLVWRSDTRALVLDHLRFFFAETRADFTGAARFSGPTGGDVDFAFYGREFVLAPMRRGEKPLRLDRTSFNGHYDRARDYLAFEGIEIGGDDVEISGALNVAGLFGDPSVAAAIRVEPMSVATLMRIWPPLLAPGARAWIDRNLKRGEVTRLDLEYATPQLASAPASPVRDYLQAHFRVADFSFTTFGDMPPIEGAEALATLAGTAFDVRIDRAGAVLPSGRRVELRNGRFTVADVFAPLPDGRIDAEIHGEAAAIAELADAEPLAVARDNGIEIDALSGQAIARIALQIPLRADVEIAEIDYRVEVDLRQFSSKAPISGRQVEKGDLTIRADNRSIRIGGTAIVDGIPAEINVNRPVAGGIGASSALTLVLREADRAKLGIELEEILRGPVRVEITESDSGETGRRQIAADLTQATLMLPQFSWVKPVGKPATATFDLIMTNGGYRIGNFSLTGSDFDIEGEIEIGSDTGIVRANFPSFALREGDEAQLRIETDNSGVSKVRLSGKRMRLENLLEAGSGRDGAESSFGNVDLDVRLDEAIGADGARIIGLRLLAARRDSEIVHFDLRGMTGGGGKIVGEIRSHKNRRRLTVRGNDGGALLRFLDVYSRVQGGDISIFVDLPLAAAGVSGLLFLTDFRIVDEPALQRIAASESAARNDRDDRRTVTGTAERRNELDVRELAVRFRRAGGVLNITNALLKSDSVGGSVSGSIDFRRDRVALKGTYVPAYTLNNLFSRLPVLGAVLGNRRNEGLIAVTFSITGAIGSPVLTVNPVSVIAPGVLRKIFEFR